MEQRRARYQVRHTLASACAALATLGAASGCWIAPAQFVATPAARSQGDDRGMALLPPFEYVSNDDAVVRIVAKGNVTCSGTLIADDLVLTAHHCVSARDEKGRVQSRDVAPSDIQIELGGDYLAWGEARVRAVVAPQCGYFSGDGDIAILVLERHLIGMPTFNAHIEGAPEVGDAILIQGFGHCALSPDGIRREARTAEKIESIAPGQFTAKASICPGDSGGPVYIKRAKNINELLGVVSASVMDGDDTTRDKSVFTRVDVWRSLFAAAHEISNGTSPSELPPFGDCHLASSSKTPR